jgi:hypothetical protein
VRPSSAHRGADDVGERMDLRGPLTARTADCLGRPPNAARCVLTDESAVDGRSLVIRSADGSALARWRQCSAPALVERG